jgi:hypothetical protein
MPLLQHTCLQCSQPFLDKRPHAKYCGNTCYGLSKRTLPELPCERCGSLFRPKDQTRFCSRVCYDVDRLEQSEKRRDKTCAHCGKAYTLPYGYAETIYCSRQCAGASQLILVNRQCPVCDKQFETPGHRPQKYCGKTCRAADRSKLKPQTCPVCENEYMPNKGGQKYCCKSCEFAGRTKYPEQQCKQCGKDFKPRKANAQYCSERCYGVSQWGLSKRAGKNFTNAQRRAIKKRDHHRCIVCYSTDRLRVDHIKPVGLGGLNTLDNGQTLCHDCHARKTARDLAAIKRAKPPMI